MASASRGNIIICDTTTGAAVPPHDYAGAAPYDYSRSAATSNLQRPATQLNAIIIKNTAASATLQLQDGGNSANGISPLLLVDLATNESANQSTYFEFKTPVFFPNGIIISAITNCSAQLFVSQVKGSQ